MQSVKRVLKRFQKPAIFGCLLSDDLERGMEKPFAPSDVTDARL